MNNYLESFMRPRAADEGISPCDLPPTLASRCLTGSVTLSCANVLMDQGLRGGIRGAALAAIAGGFLALAVPTFEDIMCTRDRGVRQQEADAVGKY